MDDFTLIENIEKRGQILRRWIGIIFSIPAVCAAGYLIVTGVKPPLWGMALLFVFLWIGALNIMQSQQRVCVLLAYRGMAEEGKNLEKIDDMQLIDLLRRKARNILFRTMIFAACVTLITVW